MKLLRAIFITALSLSILTFGFSASGRVYLRELITGVDEAEGALDPVPSSNAQLTGEASSMGAPDSDAPPADEDGQLQWVPIEQDQPTDSSEADGAQDTKATALKLIQAPVDESLYYYRSVLTEEEQEMYDALCMCAAQDSDNSSSPEITFHMDPSQDEFHHAFSRAYNALLFDHPELFWLPVSGGVFQYSYYRPILSDDTYKVTFRFNKRYTDKEERVRDFEDAAAELLSGVDLTASDPVLALQIHDALIDSVTYDKVLAESDASSDEVDLSHTAYGALVSNSRGEPRTAVCDGYSYAYEYLLQRVGIPCIVVSGLAGDDADSAAGHSWNLVQLDGEWYEVDATWNDITVDMMEESDPQMNDLVAEALYNEEYMDRLHHFMYNLTTDEISAFEPDDSYRFTSSLGWVTFLSSSVHIRHNGEDSETTGDYMTQYAPVAEGTEYSYK